MDRLLTKGSIRRGIVGFAIPIFVGNLFQQLYNTADSLIVGNYLGENALAAVSSNSAFIYLFIGFFMGFATDGCERARKEISRFAARARRGVNVQNEIHFDVYDIYRTSGIERRIIMKTTGELLNRFVKIPFAVRAADK